MFLPLLFLLLLLLLRPSSQLWTLVSNTIFLHSQRSLTIAYQLFTSTIFNSNSTSSLSLSRGLPLFSVLSIVTVANCSGICWCYILLTWPYHLSRRDFINFTISVLCNMFFISLFVHTLHHVPSSTDPYIFLSIFRSNILSACVSSLVVFPASGP